MTARLTITLALAALLTASSCVDGPAPTGPASLHAPTNAEETHSTGADAPMPHDHVPALEIIQKVDAFYHGAWLKLVIAITALVLLIGVLMPWLLQRLQTQSFDRAKDDLEAKIDSSAAKAKQDMATSEERMLARVDDAMEKTKADLEELADTTRRKMAEQEFWQSWRFFSVVRQHGQDPQGAIFVGAEAIRGCLQVRDLSFLDILLEQYVRFIRETTPKAILAASGSAIEIVEGAIAELEKHEISERAQELVEELRTAVSEAKNSKPVEGTDSTG